MPQYCLTPKEILDALEDSFGFYSIDDLNRILEFVRRNEKNTGRLVYDATQNTLHVPGRQRV